MKYIIFCLVFVSASFSCLGASVEYQKLLIHGLSQSRALLYKGMMDESYRKLNPYMLSEYGSNLVLFLSSQSVQPAEFEVENQEYCEIESQVQDLKSKYNSGKELYSENEIFPIDAFFEMISLTLGGVDIECEEDGEKEQSLGDRFKEYKLNRR